MKAHFYTLGCKLNYAETSTIENKFKQSGFTIVPEDSNCDLFVINTCSVTERADRECRQIIRKVLRKSPNAFVTVIGCYAQLQPEEIASIEGVDLVLGTKDKFKIFEHETKFEKYKTPKIKISAIEDVTEINSAFTQSTENRTRAFLKIQDGCDFNCSFCTIPLARGSSRSLPMKEIILQANKIVDEGFKEIVLTGVNVGDYGKNENTSLHNLLLELTKINDLKRIRISSIEPNLLTDNLIDFWIENEKICNHFHIPLQSGSDKILKSMRRRYTSDYYNNLINKIKIRDNNASIGVDVIVGFPGEDEIEFQKTFDLLHTMPISYLHVFTYSERENTPSLILKDRIEPKNRQNYSERLRMLSKKKKNLFISEQSNFTHNVLIESENQSDFLSGYTENYIKIKIPFANNLDNEIKKIKINSVEDEFCFGNILN